MAPAAVSSRPLGLVVLASLAYSIWAVAMSHAWLGSIPASAVMFVIGRLLFFHGYERGAAARAIGFALTFYPSALMLIASAGKLGQHVVSG